MRPRPDRRQFLRAGYLAAAAAVTGCVAPENHLDAREEDVVDETVIVAPDGRPYFEPDVLELPLGATVEFVWETGGFDLTVVAQPPDGDWGGEPEPREAGHVHVHTFDVAGVFVYESTTHAREGMGGSISIG